MVYQIDTHSNLKLFFNFGGHYQNYYEETQNIQRGFCYLWIFKVLDQSNTIEEFLQKIKKSYP